MTRRLLALVACAFAVAAPAGSARAQHSASAASCLPLFACFDVVVKGDGDGTGLVSTTDGTIDCTLAAGVGGGVCSHTYQLPWLPGATSVSFELTFVATPATGSRAHSVSQDGMDVVSQAANGPVLRTTYLIRALTRGDHSPVSLLATFQRTPFTLSVTKAGSGSGTVTSVPAGIDCGTTCAALTYYGDKVTLTAKPDAGSRFGGWTGACSGTSPTCTLTITGIPLVGASFQGVQTVSVSTSGPGSVESSPAGIDCGSTCIARFDTQSKLTLNARPDSGATFEQWTGTCAGQGTTCKLTVTAPVSTRAVFESKPPPPSTTTVTLPPPPPPPPPSPGATLTARLTSVSEVGGSLRLRLLVSIPSRARLRLLQRGVRRGQKLVGLHAGANGLRLALPPSLKAGSYRLELVIWAGRQHSTTVIQLDRKR